MILDVIRYAVFGIFALASVVAAGSWALRTRRIHPFSRTGRLVRRTTNPILQPIERWIARRGGNPQHAEAWLFGGALVGGIVAVGVATTATDIAAAIMMTRGRPGALIRTVIVLGAQVVSAAILIRVIGSWVGIHRYNRWMKPVFILTDWIVEPFRRIIPPIGPIDASPFVAWLALQLVIRLVR